QAASAQAKIAIATSNMLFFLPKGVALTYRTIPDRPLEKNMPNGKIIRLTSVILLLLTPTQAQTPAQTSQVCLADSQARCPPPFTGPDTTFIACGTSGFAGFNPPFVCQMKCGAPVGPRCRITPRESGSGGRCGFQAAIVLCFNQN